LPRSPCQEIIYNIRKGITTCAAAKSRQKRIKSFTEGATVGAQQLVHIKETSMEMRLCNP